MSDEERSQTAGITDSAIVVAECSQRLTPEQLTELLLQSLMQQRTAASAAAGWRSDQNGQTTVPRKRINSRLIHTLCHRKLDRDSFSSNSKTVPFILNSNPGSVSSPPSTRTPISVKPTGRTNFSVFEPAMEPHTYQRIDALRHQLPTPHQIQLTEVLKLLRHVIQGSKSVWVNRYEFYMATQPPHQTVR